jgi:hypothetical protein
MVAAHPHWFSITEGGPFDHLVRRLHLRRPTGMVKVWWLAGLAWLPLMIGATVGKLAGAPVDPIVLDISVHARFLVAIPLIFVSLALLEPQIGGAVRMLYDGTMADEAQLDRIVAKGERLRDSAIAEAVLLVMALAVGQLGMWGVIGASGVFTGITHPLEWSFVRVWYCTVSLPILQFLMLRWFWRWVVWSNMMVELSHLPLAAIATHPDRAGGLAFFAWPTGGYMWFVAAFSSVLSGAWGTQMLHHSITVPTIGATLVAFLVIAAVVGYAPLFLFSGHIYRARRRDIFTQGLFSLHYVRDFNGKWIRGNEGSALGSGDIQSLADMGNAYQVVATTRVIVFNPMTLKNLAIAALVPMLPLIATVIPLEKVVGKLGSTLLGLLPV